MKNFFHLIIFITVFWLISDFYKLKLTCIFHALSGLPSSHACTCAAAQTADCRLHAHQLVLGVQLPLQLVLAAQLLLALELKAPTERLLPPQLLCCGSLRSPQLLYLCQLTSHFLLQPLHLLWNDHVCVCVREKMSLSVSTCRCYIFLLDRYNSSEPLKHNHH